MCGIHGFNFKDETLINAMIASAKHRGPDGSGNYLADNLSLGHNLLYITDKPEDSRQPWVLDGGRYVLVYNGEIYNYRELRKNLQKSRHKFLTDCDTEVLAVGLATYGEDFINKLDGMFAFAWYDREKQSLLLVRDPGGMKPLYYHHKASRFAFSSELSSLLLHGMDRHFDLQAMGIYLQLGYVPGPKTLIKDIFKLIPGEVIQVSLQSGEIKNRYTSCDHIPKSNARFDEDTYREKFTNAVKHSMIGVRQFGLYLSGGLDSSAILHEACELGFKPQTLSTRFEMDGSPEYNEDADLAKKLSGHYGTKHIDLVITERNFVDAIEPTYQALGEPRYNRSSPAYFLAVKAMAESGVTITLAGDGGDELLAGYPHHRSIIRPDNKNWTQKEKRKFYLKSNFARHFDGAEQMIDRWCETRRFKSLLPELENSYNLNDYMKSWLKFKKISNDMLNNQLFLEQLSWLSEDALIRNDKLGMHFSMEARFPFLNREIKDYAMSIRHKQKISITSSKLMARKAMKTKLPDYILKKRKSGWASPVLIWQQKGLLHDRINEILSPAYYDPLYQIPFFANTTKQDNTNTKYSCLYLQVWARQYKITL